MAGISASASFVGNMNGEKCRQGTYEGYFSKASLGSPEGSSINFALGMTDDGGNPPLPFKLNGVVELGVGLGFGFPGKGALCYYYEISDPRSPFDWDWDALQWQ